MNKIEEIFKAWRISFNPNDKQADLATKRIQICNECEFKSTGTIENNIFTRCTICGCSLKAKIYTPKTYLDGSCPKEKWKEVEKEWLLENKNKSIVIDSFIISDYATFHETYDGINYHNVILPEPTEKNNFLINRKESSIIIKCNSTWDITIKKDNTDLQNDIILINGQEISFIFNGEKWILNKN